MKSEGASLWTDEHRLDRTCRRFPASHPRLCRPRQRFFYADLFVNRLIDAAESLYAFPERGREVPEAGNPAVRELLFQNYRIIYRSHAAVVEILAIVHGARDLSLMPRPPWEAG